MTFKSAILWFFCILMHVIKEENKTLIMDIDSLTSMLTLGAYVGKWNDSSGWINTSSGIFSTSAAGIKQTDKVDGTTRAEDGLRNQKDWTQSCGSGAKAKAGWKCHRSNGSLHKVNEKEPRRYFKMLTRQLNTAWKCHEENRESSQKADIHLSVQFKRKI